MVSIFWPLALSSHVMVGLLWVSILLSLRVRDPTREMPPNTANINRTIISQIIPDTAFPIAAPTIR